MTRSRICLCLQNSHAVITVNSKITALIEAQAKQRDRRIKRPSQRDGKFLLCPLAKSLRSLAFRSLFLGERKEEDKRNGNARSSPDTRDLIEVFTTRSTRITYSRVNCSDK